MAPRVTTPKQKKTVVAKQNTDAAEEVSTEDKNPGVVYIGHVPHGFYEDEMMKYFSQFGKVVALRICRSKKNGKSKGYAFVKFRFAAVAKTVAESSNNYLFFNKLMKCEYRPLSEVHKDTFIKKRTGKPGIRAKRAHNKPKEDKVVQIRLKKSLSKQDRKLNKLAKIGINLELQDVAVTPQVLTDDSKETKTKSETSTKRKRSPSKSPVPLPSSKKAKLSVATNGNNTTSASKAATVPAAKLGKPQTKKKSLITAAAKKVGKKLAAAANGSKTTSASKAATVPAAKQGKPQAKKKSPTTPAAKKLAAAANGNKTTSASKAATVPAAKQGKPQAKKKSPTAAKKVEKTKSPKSIGKSAPKGKVGAKHKKVIAGKGKKK